ncbi:g1539 [Coccomyxa elongata]
MAPQEAKKPSILVTGAAGGMQGATGRVLAERLLKRGVSVRALVRTDDERAASLRAAGAEVVVGNLLKIEDLRRAAQGVDYMFFTFAVQGGLLEASTIAAIAARDAGKHHHTRLKGIINNSQWCADLLSPSPVSHRHALSEAVFDAFPTPTVHLRGAIYHANLTMQFGRSAAESGVTRAPYMAAEDKVPLTAGADVAAAADAVLKDFQSYVGQKLLLISQRLSMDEIASEFSKAFNKQVAFQPITPEAWHHELNSSTGGMVNSVTLEHLQILWTMIRDSNEEGHNFVPGPAELTAAVPATEFILARKPVSFSETLIAMASA